MSRKRLTVFLIYLSLALFYILVPLRLAPPSGDLSAFKREMDARLPRVMQSAHVPGASLALIQNGEVVWSQGYGWAEVERRAPVTPQTLFQVASISKTATAWGVMKLIEDGSLALDAPAESYLTRWHLPPSEFNANQVTIRRLLSHTSGIAASDYVGYPPGQPLPSLEESLINGPPPITGQMGQFPGTQFTGPTRLVAPPGDRFIYSDSNFVVLQLIVEEVTGEPFAAYMQRAVLTPLGMTDSSFNRTPDLVAHTALPYDVSGAPIPGYAFTELAPAGLYTTASDLARLVVASLPGPNGEPPGRGLLSPTSVAAMISPQVRIPGLDGWVYANAYGYGYFIEPLSRDENLIAHSGGNLGWACEFSAFPSTGDGLVILTNGSLGHEVFAEALAVWTDWLGRDQTPVSHAILMARRVFAALTFTTLALAAYLLLRLTLDLRAGARRFDPVGLPRRRVIGAALCVVACAAYWGAGHAWMLIDVPTLAMGMLWGVNVLCVALFVNFLFVKKDNRSL